MYSLLDPPARWQAADIPAAAPVHKWSLPTPSGPTLLSLHLQENRSSLPPEGRIAVSVMVLLVVFVAIGAAVKGQTLLPMAMIIGMALLLVALEWFAARPVPSETLTIGRDWTIWCNHRGSTAQWPTMSVRLDVFRPSPFDCRLSLRCRGERLAIATCVDNRERVEVSELICDALQRARAR